MGNLVRRIMNKYRTIERVFGLGIGSLKGEELEKPEVKALIKIVETFPWTIDIAEYGFDKHLSNLYMQAVAINIQIEQRKSVIDNQKQRRD